MTSALVLIIGAAVPWVVHLAAPRQRLLALAAAIVVIVLFTLFSSVNAVLSWQLWVGLAVGLVSVFIAAWFTSRSDRDDDYHERPGRITESASETTGEL
jgi:membrane protein implicated in regulation of membrane protease activity